MHARLVERTLGCRFSDGALDEQLVESVRGACRKVIVNRGEVRADEITALVNEQLLRGTLEEADVREVLQTLVYDGEARRSALLCSSSHCLSQSM